MADDDAPPSSPPPPAAAAAVDEQDHDAGDETTPTLLERLPNMEVRDPVGDDDDPHAAEAAAPAEPEPEAEVTEEGAAEAAADTTVDGGELEDRDVVAPAETAHVAVDGGVASDASFAIAAAVAAAVVTAAESAAPSRAGTASGLRPPTAGGRLQVVQVPDSESSIVVAVTVDAPRKRFLGGFRDRKTGLEYHHASTQTFRKPARAHAAEQLTRETQTKFTKNRRVTTTATASTQMTAPGVFVTAGEDRELAPATYETADEYWARITRHVVTLQSHYRRWRAQQYVADLRRRKHAAEKWRQDEIDARRTALDAEFDARVTRRLDPRTERDFELLYHGLEVWRKEELAKLDSVADVTPEQKIQARLALLKQQSTHLATIDTMRHAVNTDRRAARIAAFFRDAGAPHKWVEPLYGQVNIMDTPEKQRARELSEIYHALQAPDTPTAARLDLLVHVRLVVEQFSAPLVTDLVSLLQREADLLSRKTNPLVFTGLRRRIQNLFLQFCETPAYNPEAARFLAVYKPPAELRNGFLKCQSCGKCLPVADFDVSFARKGFGRCLACVRLENLCLARADGTHHERLLRAVQRAELARDPASRCCFALGVADMRFLLEAIWGGRSCLNQEADLARLAFVRWRRDEPWTPWNCVLLTQEQADAHLQLDRPERVYGPALAAAVATKHLQARTKFSALAKEFA